jgi:hypothetical protein
MRKDGSSTAICRPGAVLKAMTDPGVFRTKKSRKRATRTDHEHELSPSLKYRSLL